MSSNYPPGVTGNERFLTGEPEPWEWQCRECECSFDHPDDGLICPECGAQDLDEPID